MLTEMNGNGESWSATERQGTTGAWSVHHSGTSNQQAAGGPAPSSSSSPARAAGGPAPEDVNVGEDDGSAKRQRLMMAGMLMMYEADVDVNVDAHMLVVLAAMPYDQGQWTQRVIDSA